MIQIVDKQKEEKIPAWLRLAFRPFFLLGALYAMINVSLWVWMRTTNIVPSTLQVPPLWWHAHEMLFGFVLAIISGFLLTAVQTWSGITGTKSWRLAGLVGLWVWVRISFWLPIPLWLTSILESFFILWVAYEFSIRILKTKGKNNLIFMPLFALAIFLNFASYAQVKGVSPLPVGSVFQAMVWWVSLMISVMGGRVIPFFSAKRLGFTKPNPILALDFVANFSLVCLIILSFFPLLSDGITRYILVVGGIAQLIRLLRWKGYLGLKEPLIWSLHLFYLCIPITMLFKGFIGISYLNLQLLHLLMIGAIGGVILSMITRVTMGHTGNPIYKGPNMSLAFICLIIAALVRGIVLGFAPQYTSYWLWIAAFCWLVAYSMYLYYFSKMLVTPRADGHPG